MGLEDDHRFQPPTYGYTVYASAFKRSVPGRVPTRFRLKSTPSSRKALCFQCRSHPGNAQICLPTANSGLVPARSALEELAPRQLVGVPAAALRTEKAVRPSARHQVAPAIFLRFDTILELDHGARKVSPCRGVVPGGGKCLDKKYRAS